MNRHHANISSVIVCDDIRREISGKDILIGVYSGEIVLSSIPFSLNLAIWLEYTPSIVGHNEFYIRFMFNNEPIGSINGGIDVAVITSIGLPITGFNIRGDKPGELQIEFSSDGKTFTTVSRKTLRQGDVQALTRVVPAPSPPSPA
jgi:hypothetical protein